MKYLAGIRYGQAFAQPEPSAVLTTLGRAIDLDATNDMYLRDASQVTLAMIRDEVNTAQKDSDIQRPQRIQNLITSSVQLAQRAVQVAPHESLNWSNLGTVYYALSGLVDSVERLAEDAFKKAAELRPGDPTFDQRIGEMWLNRADTVRELARNAGGSNAARLNQQANEALDQAKQAFQRALEVSPNYGLAIYNLGAIYDRQDKVSDAIAQLEKIAPYNTSNATISFELGLLYLRAGRKNDALAAMNRATLINPQYANARWYIALLLEERGDIDGALIQLLEIQKNNKENQVLRDKIVALQSGQRTPASTEVIDSEPLE
jgi:tetratricopeptide (TPR) repeat protein